MNQIRAVLDTSPGQIRHRHRGQSPVRLIKAITRARPDPTNPADPAVATTVALKLLGA